MPTLIEIGEKFTNGRTDDRCLVTCADLEGGSGGSGPPREFAKLNIADITGNEKISYFSYLCTSTIIRQTESILLKVGSPLEKFSGSAPVICPHGFSPLLSQ